MSQEVEAVGVSELDDAGGPDPDGGPADPDGGLPDPDPDPDPAPMFGQFFDEPDAVPEFELDPEPVPVDEFEDPDPVDPVLMDPVPVDPVGPVPVDPDPVAPVLELEDGVVVDVVAALATSAPPARSPDVNAPAARTLRRRICMWVCPFFWVQRRFVRSGTTHGAPRN
jgi:hypothetical protein